MIEDENELAGLLAHETSHINGRHSLRIISKDLATYKVINLKYNNQVVCSK
ncbi:MAG: M48 family metalloprotease [Flavobacteriaceae bacterium]